MQSPSFGVSGSVEVERRGSRRIRLNLLPRRTASVGETESSLGIRLSAPFSDPGSGLATAADPRLRFVVMAPTT